MKKKRSGEYISPMIECTPIFGETPILVASRNLEALENVNPYSGFDPFLN